MNAEKKKIKRNGGILKWIFANIAKVDPVSAAAKLM